MRGGLAGHGLDRNELLLKKAQQLSDLARLAIVMANYMSESSFSRYTLHLKGEEVFGSAKQPVDCFPSVNNDFHWLDRVNFFHP